MAEEFALLEKKVEHDLRLVKSWAQKVRDRESQLDYPRFHYKEARASKAAEAASHLFSPGHQNIRFHSVSANDQPISQVFSCLQGLINAISNKYRAGAISQARPPLALCMPA